MRADPVSRSEKIRQARAKLIEHYIEDGRGDYMLWQALDRAIGVSFDSWMDSRRMFKFAERLIVELAE